MKKQVLVIHGGSAYATYEEYLAGLKESEFDLERLTAKGWKDNLPTDLGPDFEVIAPEMPNWWNAKYIEWKIWFEKILPLMRGNSIFIGHSLGSIFLTKYFSENQYPKKIAAIILIASPFNQAGMKREDSIGDFILSKDLSLLKAYGPLVHLYHSEDDRIVSFEDFKKMEEALPDAQAFAFKDRKHFNQATFPDIIEDIKKSMK